MAVKQFLKSSRMTALAAGVAFIALPLAAHAEPGEGRNHRDGDSMQQSAPEVRESRGGEDRGGENRGNGGGGWQQRQAAQAQAQAQAQPQAAPQQGGWNGGARGMGGGMGGGWQQRSEQAAPPVVMAPAPQAQAQAESRGGWGGRNSGGWSGGSQNGGGWQQRAQAQPQADAQADAQAQAQAQARGWNDGQRGGGNWRGNDGDRHQDRARGNDGWRGNDNRSWDNRSWDNRGWNNNARYGYNQGYNQNWNRDWRHDNRYNWSGYRNDHRSIFQLGNYYSPYRGYSYRRLTIGFTLNSLFFGSDYVIDNPWMYRLPEAYGPYRWVRYYDDAVLVNIYDGEVEDVIYNFFW